MFATFTVQGFQLEQCFLNGQYQISNVDLNSPAFNAHLQKGDQLLKVNQRTVVGWNLQRILSLINDKSTSVILTVKRRPKHGQLLYEIYLRPAKTPKRKSNNYVIEESSEAGVRYDSSNDL